MPANPLPRDCHLGRRRRGENRRGKASQFAGLRLLEDECVTFHDHVLVKRYHISNRSTPGEVRLTDYRKTKFYERLTGLYLRHRHIIPERCHHIPSHLTSQIVPLSHSPEQRSVLIFRTQRPDTGDDGPGRRRRVIVRPNVSLSHYLSPVQGTRSITWQAFCVWHSPQPHQRQADRLTHNLA